MKKNIKIEKELLFKNNIKEITSISLDSEYKVDNNKLSIDFFGYDVRMTRQSGREKKSSNSEY